MPRRLSTSVLSRPSAMHCAIVSAAARRRSTVRRASDVPEEWPSVRPCQWVTVPVPGLAGRVQPHGRLRATICSSQRRSAWRGHRTIRRAGPTTTAPTQAPAAHPLLRLRPQAGRLRHPRFCTVAMLIASRRVRPFVRAVTRCANAAAVFSVLWSCACGPPSSRCPMDSGLSCSLCVARAGSSCVARNVPNPRAVEFASRTN